MVTCSQPCCNEELPDEADTPAGELYWIAGERVCWECYCEPRDCQRCHGDGCQDCGWSGSLLSQFEIDQCDMAEFRSLGGGAPGPNTKVLPEKKPAVAA